MNPVSRLPPEVLENIWKSLGVRDLLNCRLVATAWNKVLVGDPVWKRYLSSSLPEVSAWENFLEQKKLDFRWNHGIYKEYVTDIFEAQFGVGDGNLYIGKDKCVKCYSPALEEIHSYVFDFDVAGIHPFSNMVAFVLNKGKFKYEIKIFKAQTSLGTFESNVNRISAGTKQVCFQVQDSVLVFDGKKTIDHSMPGDVVEIMAINDRLLVKTVSSVFMGSNYSMYLHTENGWEVIWKGRNTPMGFSFGLLESTADTLALVGGTLTDSGYNYTGLHIHGMGLVDEIKPSRIPYFRSCSSDDSVVYTHNERLLKRLWPNSMRFEETEVEPGLQIVRTRGSCLVLVYNGRWWLRGPSSIYARQGPSSVEGAVVKETFMALWSKTKLHIYHFGASCDEK